ncbi:O-antigen ligase family protein [Mycolicibacterium sp. ELW1]|uniref:O-antigen ligase family protein n=1 Tax=unclassified Mycolicibacterium TaxID=2636767 RepID=UPI003D780722
MTLASLVIALASANHRWQPYALSGAFFVRIAVPSEVGNISVSGALPSLHVSTVLILFYCVVWPLATRRKEASTPGPAPIPVLCHVIIGTVAAGSVIMSGSLASMGFVAGLTLNQIVAPYLFCVLVYNASRRHISLYEHAGRLFALICVLEAVIALAVHLQLVPQPYLSTFSSLNSWSSLVGRERGTLEHPLALGLFLVAGIPMAVYFRSRIMAYVAILLMVLGISFTQSRIAMLGAVAGIVYLMLIGSKSIRQRITLLIVAFAGYTALDSAGAFDGIRDRIKFDDGSSRGRILAFNQFVDNWRQFQFAGVGMELNKEYFRTHGIRSSGESAAIGYAVGIGIPLTLLYFAAIVWLIGRAVKQANRITPAAASAIIVLVSIQLYSSVTTESAAGMILWTTIGIALAAPSVAGGEKRAARYEPVRRTPRASHGMVGPFVHR